MLLNQFDDDSMEKISSPSSLSSSTPSLSSSLTSSKGVEKSRLHQMTPPSTASIPGMSSSPSPFHPSLPALKLGNDKKVRHSVATFCMPSCVGNDAIRNQDDGIHQRKKFTLSEKLSKKDETTIENLISAYRESAKLLLSSADEMQRLLDQVKK